MMLLGVLVGVADVAQFVLQMRRVLAVRADHGAVASLSTWTWIIATLQACAWVIYGFAEHLLPIALPNLIIAPVCATVAAIRIRHGIRAREVSDRS